MTRCEDREEPVTVLINSSGGDMFAGTEIRSLLRQWKGQVTALVQGHAASAATIAMTGADRIVADVGALLCYHNPSIEAQGDYLALLGASREAKNARDAILDVYCSRFPGCDRAQVQALMDKNTWITAAKALEYGLLDGTDTDEAEPTGNFRFAAAAGGYPVVTDKMREAYLAAKHPEPEPPAPAADSLDAQLAQAVMAYITRD